MSKYKNDKITVYTPTYNRGYCLHQLYESLVSQSASFNDFVWLIVDDGSTDNTETLVNKWSRESSFNIIYHKQINEGKMAKLNFIHRIIDTELCMCVDSDDYLLKNSIKEILDLWKEIREKKELAGIVGLNVFKNGNIVGTEFPPKISRIKFSNFEKYKVNGDKKFIFRTEILTNYPPYPNFYGEKFPAPGYLYRLIDVDFDLWAVNQPFCVVEYLQDGLSMNKYSQFKKAPNSWMFYRLERMRLANNYSEKFKNSIHYVSSCIFAGKSFFKQNPYFITTLLALPFGLCLNLYLKRTNNKGVIK